MRSIPSTPAPRSGIALVAHVRRSARVSRMVTFTPAPTRAAEHRPAAPEVHGGCRGHVERGHRARAGDDPMPHAGARAVLGGEGESAAATRRGRASCCGLDLRDEGVEAARRQPVPGAEPGADAPPGKPRLNEYPAAKAHAGELEARAANRCGAFGDAGASDPDSGSGGGEASGGGGLSPAPELPPVHRRRRERSAPAPAAPSTAAARVLRRGPARTPGGTSMRGLNHRRARSSSIPSTPAPRSG